MSMPDGGVPPRPDVHGSQAAGVPTRRSRSTPVIVIVSIVAGLVFVAVALTVCVAAVDKVGQSAFDQFDQIDYCLKHPHDPTCRASFVPSP